MPLLMVMLMFMLEGGRVWVEFYPILSYPTLSNPISS